MISSFKNTSIKLTILALSLTLVIGCSKTTSPPKSTTDNTQNQNVASDNSTTKLPTNDNSTTKLPTNDNSSIGSGDNTSTTAPIIDKSQKEVLSDILKLAKEGKIINCKFPVKTTVIENVEKEWGQPDKTDWVAAAKGTYATYLKKNIVFGFNKGSQIFEIRSLSKDLNKISLSMIKNFWGTPAYNVKTKSEEIIGYTAGQNYKLLFVFPRTPVNGTDQFMVHYSVLYPKGTVNNMSGDPGRQW